MPKAKRAVRISIQPVPPITAIYTAVRLPIEDHRAICVIAGQHNESVASTMRRMLAAQIAAEQHG